MSKVKTLKEAMSWFLSNSSGSILCVNGDKEKECKSYPEAEEFYN